MEEPTSTLQCSICFSYFTDPRALQCGHTFCFKCIKSSSVSQTTCSLCQTVTLCSPSSLPINTSLKNIIEYLFKSNILSKKQSSPCVICNNPQSIVYCAKCEVFMCDVCNKAHSSSPFTKTHVVVADMVDQSKKSNIIGVCEKHEDKIRMFCVQCKVLVCSTCIIDDHLQHKESVLYIDKAASQQREKLQSLIQPLKQQKQKITERVIQIDEELSKLQKEKERLINQRRDVESGVDLLNCMSRELTDLQILNENNLTEILKILKIKESQIFFQPKKYLIKNQYKFLTKFGSTKGSGDSQFNVPIDVTIDTTNGNIIVADCCNHRIQVFHSNGTFIRKFGSEGSGDGQFKEPRGVAIDSKGNIVVSDHNHRIQVFSSNGSFIRKFGSQGSGDSQLSGPNHIAIDSNENIIVADTGNNRIQVFRSNGTFIQKFGSEGSDNGQFNNPCGVAVDSKGNIVVSDHINHRIQVFSSNGSFIQKFGSQGSGDGQLSQPWGVTTDSNGNIIVADCYNHRIQVFSNTGTFIQKFGSNGSSDGQLCYPYGVAIDSNGNIIVADGNNDRIAVFGD